MFQNPRVYKMLFSSILSITIYTDISKCFFRYCGMRTPNFYHSFDRNDLNELTKLSKVYYFFSFAKLEVYLDQKF